MQTSAHIAGSFAPIPLDPLAELRRELMNWAEPVIADRILEAYRRHDLGIEWTRTLAGHHRRLWRAIILEKRGMMETMRHELLDDIARVGLASDVADLVDQNVIEELIDIVLKRFRTSGERVKGFSMILLGAASHISPSRGVMYS